MEYIMKPGKDQIAPEEKSSNIGFFFLLVLLGISFVAILGYLIYSIAF